MAFSKLLNKVFEMFHVEHYRLWKYLFGQCSTWNIARFLCFFTFVFALNIGQVKAQKVESGGYKLLFETEERASMEQVLNNFSLYWELRLPDTLLFVGLKKEDVELSLKQYVQGKGYLTAEIIDRKLDTLDSLSLPELDKLKLGPVFSWLKISPKSAIEKRWLRQAEIKFEAWDGAILNARDVFLAEKKLLEVAENNGYPFAKVYLDSLKEEEFGQFSSLFVLDKGAYYTFGSVDFKSPVKLPQRYMANLIGIQKGDFFSRQKVLDIEKRLLELPFLQLKESPKVRFSEETAQVKLVFEEKKANRFDFLIGLLPQGAGSTRTILTGSLDALFYNVLNQGERFALKLERLRPESQRMDLGASAPYLFGLPFGGDFDLHINKRDSTFLDVNGRLGVHYLFENGDKIQVFLENKSSSLLTVDTQKVIQTERLPTALDLKKNSFGLAWQHSTLDYRLNPRAGLWMESNISVGLNRIFINSQVDQIATKRNDGTEFRSLYDGLARSSTRFQSEQTLDFYQPIQERSTVLFGFRGFALFSEEPIYQNEQYRLGGARSIRGFDEESIFSTRAAFGTLEYRFLLSKDAHLAAFSDYGFFENKTEVVEIRQRLLSFGLGMALQTAGGQFKISIATGKNQDNGFDLRASKFHLGFISLF